MIPLPRSLKTALKANLPRGLNVGAAVVQLFLNDGRTTRLGLVNFPSLLAPTSAQDYRYHLRTFDEDGGTSGQAVVDLPRYGSAEVDLPRVFGDRLPRMGMIAVGIRPARFFSMRDRHLGKIRPHFFTLFLGPRMESVGLVHPQTHLGADAAPERHWVSNLQIDPALVPRVEVFQVNPSARPVESKAYLQGGSGEVLSESNAVVPPRGVRRIEFDLSPYDKHHSAICVGLRGLAASNGKPILFLHFRDGSFTCCHA